MKYEKATLTTDTKNNATLTLHFTDTDPSMPQMDNMITREVCLTLKEWEQIRSDIAQLV